MTEVEKADFCKLTCPGDGGKICGGDYGAISVYPNFPALSMAGLTITAKDKDAKDLSEPNPEANMTTHVTVYIDVGIGDYTCSTESPTCINGFLPPVVIDVDYGDGSGIAQWTRESAQDLWRHMYSSAGLYTITITVTGVYDLVVQRITTQVRVTDPLRHRSVDQPEIICPHVIHPGDFFKCIIDVPGGTGISGRVRMKDDLTGDTDTTFGKFEFPDAWRDMPGGHLRFASYNNSYRVSDVTKGYVLPLTYFGHVANISALELLPVGTGSIIIELVSPVCGGETPKWCSLTKTCEKNCVSKFETITRKYAGFQNRLDDFSCEASPTKVYCSNEETCLHDLKCPTSITKNVAPGNPVSFKVFKELYNGQVTAGKKVRMYTPFLKELNDEDESDEDLPYAGFKTHAEEAYPGDLFLAFRCSAGSVALCAQLPYE